MSYDSGSLPSGLDASHTDDSSTTKVARRESDGGLLDEGSEDIIIGTIVGLSDVNYRSVSDAITFLVSRHEDLERLMYHKHKVNRCICRTKKVYQKIVEEIGPGRPKIVYCFLTSLATLKMYGTDFQRRNLVLDGDLRFLRDYLDSTPKKR